MTLAGTNYALRIPGLPDPVATHSIIKRAIIHRVTGRVAAVAGENVEVEGMTAPLGAICEIQPADGPPCAGRVIGFRDVRPILAPLDYLQTLSAGDSVRLLDTSVQLHVGPALCGRIIDAQGRPLDGRPLPEGLARVDAHQQPPDSLDRPPIDNAFQTGVRAIDAMLTCGEGQRLGIFAGSGIGKSTLMGMLARGSSADRIVIGMVGERGREVQEFIHRCLGDAGLKRSVVVVATSDTPAAQRVLAAWTATAIAESFRDRGENVLLLIDSVTRFAMAQRELGLAASEPPTTRGYPPSVFNVLPRLVERAGRTSKGSITAFYTVLVEGDDHNEPIADALRGLLDGHIVLSRELAAQAHWPPIDVLESLSRLQPHLVEPEILRASGLVRKHLSDFRRSADLISIGAYRDGSDPAIDAAIAMREPLKIFMTQDSNDLTPIEKSHAALVALSGHATQSALEKKVTSQSAAVSS
jgi:flagellum-specific ATP synthase